MSVFRQLYRCLWFNSVASFCALRLCLSLCALSLMGIGGVHAEEAPDHDTKVRIILSSGGLTDINVNDATATFRVWLSKLGQKMNVPIAEDALILSSMEAIAREMDQYPNHLVSLSLPEYLGFEAGRFSRNIYLGKNDRDSDSAVGNRYLVLVREDSSIQALSELRDKKLVHYDHRETAMAQEWFDYNLAETNQVSSSELLSSYSKDTDLAKVVLGVFFGRIDACLVSDRSFDLLCEMNPQLRSKLKVLARSPVVVGDAMFTQSDCDPLLEVRLDEVVEWLRTDISGKQILTLFRSESVFRTDLSELQYSIDLYKKWTSVKEVAE